MAEYWLARSKAGPVSEYHLQAYIALQHCLAGSVESTDWRKIVDLYDRLLAMNNSPVYALNRAIAKGQVGDLAAAHRELQSLRLEQHHVQLLFAGLRTSQIARASGR